MNLFVNQILYFSNLFSTFLGREKLLFLDESEFSYQVIFFPSKKIAKENLKKKVKCDLYIDFDMEIRLNSSLDQF
jgi:hypothetical protein